MRLIINNSKELDEKIINYIINFIDTLNHSNENIYDIDINNSDNEQELENNKNNKLNFQNNMDVIYEIILQIIISC